MSSPFDLAAFLETRTVAVNAALDRFLPSEKTKPATIHRAVRYSLFAGGKRMRPARCITEETVTTRPSIWGNSSPVNAK